MVHPLIWTYIHQIGKWHQELTGYRLVVTSLSRGSGHSYHNQYWAGGRLDMEVDRSTAFDMRRWYFPDFPTLEKFCLEVKQSLDIGCLIEPEWMTAKQIAGRGGIHKISPHVHWQLSTRNQLWLNEVGQFVTDI